MVRVVPKPQPFKRFQRHLVDSLWQVDVDGFRSEGVKGKVYVHTVLDDRSRFLGMARGHRRERAHEATNNLGWAFKSGRKPTAISVDNGSCFISKEFRQFCRDHHIRLS